MYLKNFCKIYYFHGKLFHFSIISNLLCLYCTLWSNVTSKLYDFKMLYEKESTNKIYKLYKFFLQTKGHFLLSCFHRSKVNIHHYSRALNYLLLETKEGFIKWFIKSQHVSAKLQKTSVCPGNVTLVAERILFEEAIDRIETDFQKKYNTGLCIFFKCTSYPQT